MGKALPFFHMGNFSATLWNFLKLSCLKMDPLSIGASVLTVITATITTVKTLNETVGRYRGRDKTLARLQGGLHDLISILKSLKEAAAVETPILALLKGPVSRCAQVSTQKIHIIGDVIADGDCDQVVVTALADLFHVGTVKAQGRSMQMVGSMPADTIREMSKDRYGSRFGSLDGKLAIAQLAADAVPPSTLVTTKKESPVRQSDQVKEVVDTGSAEGIYNKPSSNEVRKRKADGESGMK